MFGIGLPEMIVILAVALIVVGPDKLPELAKSLAKGVLELKRTVNQVKDNLTEEGTVINSVKEDLNKTTADLKQQLLDEESKIWQPGDEEEKNSGIIDLKPVNKDDIPGPPPEIAENSQPESESVEEAEEEMDKQEAEQETKGEDTKNV